MKSRIVAVIPTYNENDNIVRIIPDILSRHECLEVLVVDDSSPDGTGETVRQISLVNPRVHILSRPGKQGLGRAYVAGFRYALDMGADVIFQMDADFSHDPKYIVPMLHFLKDFDVVTGSRYVNGVSVVNWPLRRLFLSYGANVYARLVTGLRVMDSTSGFKAWKRSTLEGIDFDSVESNGYSFQIEMTHRAVNRGFAVGEYPIIFVDRTSGQSKMSRAIVHEAILMVWKLRLGSLGFRLFS
ncbi:MAG: dolichyl-phosphate beta-D-mannosyltransferase [Candidatus Wallbacteria bacterium HGW-Wallbacteria-1]|uniref:Dolichyl-phosphate beta-D-mannosyltransferase n=1 Tax=Candidatus Wallbacteria bacterium HGW-Wallbacteria-1 TaxID=2013854 RepID=A0A2N1PQ97_9BACT|nr:MAG: dolichyl-phosphate beta-D-mannosyltransferase [Candidatus Wallbacteria bacterium HGW-Wallbacteria-1]